MNKTIVSMGSVNMDLTMYMQALPAAGETVLTDNFATFPGGKAGNQAAAAAALGGNVRVVAKLGDDPFSQQLTNEFIKRGVCTDDIEYVPGQTAGIAMIRVDAQGRNSISFTPGANAFLSPEDVKMHQAAFEENGILLLTLELKMETVRQAMLLAKSKHMQIVLDPSPVPADGLPEEICHMVDFAKPNELEAEALSGIAVTDYESAEKACRQLMKMGIAHPIISMSDKGALTVIKDEVFLLKPKKVVAIDSTAAGDVFLGSFTTALSKGHSLKDCLIYANTAAAVSTTKKGAQTSIPSPEEVAAAL